MADSYSKSAFAKQLGISTGDLESKARSAGFDATEDYYNSGQWNSGGGGNMIDPNQIPSMTDYANKIEQPITDAYSKYIDVLRNRADPLDVYNSLESEAGIPGMKKTATTLREQIGSIEDTIKRVEPTVAATTTQSMVTEGQRQKMVVAEQKPLLERLGEMVTGLGRVEAGIQAGMQDLTTKVSLYMQGQDQQLEPLKVGIQAMTDRASRLMSAYSIDAQNKFEVYLANIRRGWDLDDKEREEAFSLLQGENEYRKTLVTSAAGAGIRLNGDESNEEILSLIGDAAAEELRISRQNKTNENAPIKWPWENGEWVIENQGNISTGNKEGALQSPQKSGIPGTIETTQGPNGQTIYWVADENGGWN